MHSGSAGLPHFLSIHMCRTGIETDELLPIPGWEGHYWLCEECQIVYTKKRNGSLKKMRLARGKVYLEITLNKKIDGIRKRRHHLASRVFLMAYTGKNPKGKEAHHKNGRVDDLSRENLMWLTKRQNLSKYYKTGKLNEDLFEKRSEDPF